MQSIDLAGINHCTTSGLLAVTAGAVTTYDTTVAINFSINGIMHSRTTVATGATPTADPVNSTTFTSLAINKGCVFVWCLNLDSTVSVFQSAIENLDAAGNFIVAPEFPLIPDAYVPFAYQVIKNGSTGSAFAFGTTAWNATGITSSIKNLCVLPNRPQVS